MDLIVVGKQSYRQWHAMRYCRLSNLVQVFLALEEDDVDQHVVLQEGGRERR